MCDDVDDDDLFGADKRGLSSCEMCGAEFLEFLLYKPVMEVASEARRDGELVPLEGADGFP